jgi:hypothetical protein
MPVGVKCLDDVSDLPSAANTYLAQSASPRVQGHFERGKYLSHSKFILLARYASSRVIWRSWNVSAVSAYTVRTGSLALFKCHSPSRVYIFGIECMDV